MPSERWWLEAWRHEVVLLWRLSTERCSHAKYSRERCLSSLSSSELLLVQELLLKEHLLLKHHLLHEVGLLLWCKLGYACWHHAWEGTRETCTEGHRWDHLGLLLGRLGLSSGYLLSWLLGRLLSSRNWLWLLNYDGFLSLGDFRCLLDWAGLLIGCGNCLSKEFLSLFIF